MKAIFVFLCCIPLLSISQEPFQRITFGPYMFSCDGADVGVNGGYTATYGYGSSDIYLLRIDRFGNLRWARTVGEEGSEAPGEVKQLRDGNFLVVGNSNVPGKDYQIYLVKFNNDCYQQSCTPGYFRLGEDISWRSDQSNKFG